jgi:hypothetical protein
VKVFNVTLIVEEPETLEGARREFRIALHDGRRRAQHVLTDLEWIIGQHRDEMRPGLRYP